MSIRRVAASAAMVLLFVFAGVASAHTGTIEVTQKCDTGNIITAHLNEDVAADAAWVITANGEPLDEGTGPGPADLGPYTFSGAGTVTLSITFGQETNVYEAELLATKQCPHSTPPSRKPTPSIPTAPPSDIAGPPAGGSSTGILLSLGILATVSFIAVSTRKWVTTKS